MQLSIEAKDLIREKVKGNLITLLDIPHRNKDITTVLDRDENDFIVAIEARSQNKIDKCIILERFKRKTITVIDKGKQVETHRNDSVGDIEYRFSYSILGSKKWRHTIKNPALITPKNLMELYNEAQRKWPEDFK
jgi:hypothetical protein